MAVVITKVDFVHRKRGEQVIITGTGFGATQGDGTVTVGGVELDSIIWNTDYGAYQTITGNIDALTPLGAQDLVVIADDATTATLYKGVFVYSAVSVFDTQELKFRKVNRIYLDGEHIGNSEAGFNFSQQLGSAELIPNETYEPVAVETWVAGRQVAFTFNNFAPELMAKLLNGSYDSNTRMLSLYANRTFGEHSLMMIEDNGLVTVIKRVKLMADISIDVNKNWSGVATQWRVMALADADQKPVEIYFPTAS